MAEHAVLLPGWALGVTPMAPLADALRERGVDVTVQPLPAFADVPLDIAMDALARDIRPDSWLIGWSLGGMLAATLAARAEVRCRGLVTLGANARFVADASWPEAMPADTFQTFMNGCSTTPDATLKRFALLCSQGAEQPRTLSKSLLPSAAPDAGQLVAGLDVLAALDMRIPLATYKGPRLHVFADRDALVPAAACTAFAALSEAESVALMTHASHAFVVDRADELARLVTRRMNHA